MLAQPNQLSKATSEDQSLLVLTSLDILVGELAVSLLCLISKATSYHADQNLQQRAGAGFMLPANIGDLDPSITVLDLRRRNLTGNNKRATFLCY